MKIIVEKEKLTSYLLKPRSRNDKSKFLNSLGFSEENWQLLQKALINLYLHNKAEKSEENPYGIIYKVTGLLNGLNGNSLNIITIWINQYSSDEMRFVTLFPDREAK